MNKQTEKAQARENSLVNKIKYIFFKKGAGKTSYHIFPAVLYIR